MHLLAGHGLVAGLGVALFAVDSVLAQAGLALGSQYRLGTSYDRRNFFQFFDFFTEPDPTHGFVEYVDQATAQQSGLIGYSAGNGSVVMGVDHKTVSPARGRMSVRVTSKQSFTHGLFVADIAHIPSSTCGVWPAFWMFGPNWPSSGEIDIIKGVNSQAQGAVTLHTAAGCSVANTGSMPSTYLKAADCGAGGSSGGCGQQTADRRNYGSGFNAVRGGVYATEWTSEHIAVWFFPRSAIPRDVASGQPEPASWGASMARFAGGPGRNIDSHFANHKLVVDTTFCGDWAGNPAVWAADPMCSAKAATCEDYVSANPGDFGDAFWDINSVKVYYQQRPGQQDEAGYQAAPGL